MLLFLQESVTDLHLNPFDINEWLPLLFELVGRLFTLLKNYKITFGDWTFSVYSFLLALFVIGIVLPVVVNVAHSIALGNENRSYNLRNKNRNQNYKEEPPTGPTFGF